MCNSDDTTSDRTAICPPGNVEVREDLKKAREDISFFKVTEAEIECSCLQRRQVEEDLINGVSPLGLLSKQCYQVSSDMIYLYKNGIRVLND